MSNSSLKQTEPHRFPSPIGGAPLPSDFVPSIIFAGLYGLLFPVIAYRVSSKRSRSLIFINLTIPALGKTALFTVRAIQSNNDSLRFSGGILQWMQTDFALMYSGLLTTVLWLFRSVRINATKLVPPTDDIVKARSRFRRIMNISLALITIGMQTICIPMGILYKSAAEGKVTHVSTASALRSAATIIMLDCTVNFIVVVCYMRQSSPAIDKKACLLLCYLSIPIMIVSIYRFVVVGRTTTALTSTAPGSLNSPLAKAAFYIFHILPEWIFIAALVGMNSREVFRTGPFGDRKSDDAKYLDGIQNSGQSPALLELVE